MADTRFPRSVSVSLDDETYKALADAAYEEDRTLSAQARRVLRLWAEQPVNGEAEQGSLDPHWTEGVT